MYVNEFGFSVCVLFLAALLQLIEELSILQLFWLTRILSEGLAAHQQVRYMSDAF